MTLATVQVNERNGAPAGTLESGVANLNCGSTDAPNLVAADFAITPGNNAFEKWTQFEVTSMGTSLKVDNLRFWKSAGTLQGSTPATIDTNARTTAYGGAETYAQPTASTSTVADQAVATSLPGSANLGIGGSLSGSITSPGSSDYCVFQVQTSAGTDQGSTITLRYSYDEVA